MAVIPRASLIKKRYSGCDERQVSGLTRSYRRSLYLISLKEQERPYEDRQIFLPKPDVGQSVTARKAYSRQYFVESLISGKHNGAEKP